jgi:hypothetical protein
VRIGVGMTPQHLARLSRPDARLDPGDGDMVGSDIRLTLTKRLVEAMDGAIGAESAAGARTTLWVDLPAAAPEERPVDRAATSQARPGGEPAGPAPTGPRTGRSPGRLRQRWLALSVRRKLQARTVPVATVPRVYRPTLTPGWTSADKAHPEHDPPGCAFWPRSSERRQSGCRGYRRDRRVGAAD